MTSSWFFLSTLNYHARSTTHQICKPLGILFVSFAPEDEGIVLFLLIKADNHSPSDIASHTGRPESATTKLWKPHIYIYMYIYIYIAA